MTRKMFVTSITLALALLAVVGCQRSRTVAGDPVAEAVRVKMSDLGLASARFEPEPDIEAYYASKAGGIAKGAARGASQSFSDSSELVKGAGCSGWSCGPFYVFWAATSSWAAVGGFFAGASQGFSNTIDEENYQILQYTAKTTLAGLNTQEALREALKAEIRRRTNFTVDMLNFGPESPDVDARYACNLGCQTKTVVEAAITRIGFRAEQPRYEGAEQPLSLFMTCRVRLVMSPIDDTVDLRELTVVSPPRARPQWEADNSRLFFEQFAALNGFLAEKIVNDLFLTHLLPLSL
jgi:hypothetical protein